MPELVLVGNLDLCCGVHRLSSFLSSRATTLSLFTGDVASGSSRIEVPLQVEPRQIVKSSGWRHE